MAISSSQMFIDDLSITPDSIDNERVGTSSENPGTYTYNVDLTTNSTFILTGDFETGVGTEIRYNQIIGFAEVSPPGTFTLDQDTGEFTYTVTLSEILAFGEEEVSIRVNGDATSPSGTDTDTLQFNFTICFAHGTRIATAKGEVAVETLQPGDILRTADGREVPVKFLWHTTVSPMFEPADRLEPVLIRAGALGDTPTRDLVVTADHGMVLDGFVINASALVGQPGVEWLGWKALGPRFSYYHVETEAHDVILAEGAAAETYLDVVERSSFDNYTDYLKLYGAEQTIAENPLPRISSARLLPTRVIGRFAGTEMHKKRA